MSQYITPISPFTTPQENDSKTFSARSFVDAKSIYFFFKRVFDLVFSAGFILFILSWLVPLLAIIIRLDSRGAVFFLQKRVGRGGKSFYCLKFRTMYKNSGSHTVQIEKTDRRITRVGRLLRRSNLDEFPQFINVFMGQMSLVGPRPHMHSDCARFSNVVNGYKFRNMVKPGITGLAQVKGYHGPAISYESIFRRFQWDAFYVRNASFWLDLRILRQTLSGRLGRK